MTLGGWRVRGGAGQPLEMAEARAEFENAVHHALVELRDAAQFVNAQIPSSQLGPPPSAAGGAASSSARAPSPPASSDGEVVGACVLGALVDNACTPPLEALIDALAAAIGRSATPPPRGVLRAVSLASEGLHAALEAGAWHVREACEVHAAERWAQLAATRSAVERELFARSSAGGSTPELLAFVARQEAHAELRGALATFVHAPIAAAVDEGAREGAALIGVLGALASKAQHELLTTAALPPDTPEAAPIGAREAARRLSQEAEEAEAEEGWAHAQAANWEVWEGN
ncbi:hypothetical protein T492DRAFT_1041484 [Pavlovales sp. CCMP2436]|nr:hypothetical protein T492DRAFT_1041484 [Pavlovales sp. CCMP2436]